MCAVSLDAKAKRWHRTAKLHSTFDAIKFLNALKLWNEQTQYFPFLFTSGLLSTAVPCHFSGCIVFSFLFISIHVIFGYDDESFCSFVLFNFYTYNASVYTFIQFKNQCMKRNIITFFFLIMYSNADAWVQCIRMLRNLLSKRKDKLRLTMYFFLPNS